MTTTAHHTQQGTELVEPVEAYIRTRTTGKFEGKAKPDVLKLEGQKVIVYDDGIMDASDHSLYVGERRWCLTQEFYNADRDAGGNIPWYFAEGDLEFLTKPQATS